MRSDLMLEVRQARYFIAVAEELHFGRAAERLHMSQPPLSQAIARLEKDLGARLLDRTSRRVSLTEAGRTFLTHCHLLVSAAERAAAIAAQADAGLLGTLSIGAVTSAFTEPLPAVLDRFRASRPDVELRVREIDTHQGRDALLRHEIDVAIIRHAGTGRTLVSRPLRRDHFVLALPGGHPLAGEAFLDLADLRHDPWVWLRREISPGYHDELVAACRQAGFSPDTRHHANSITSQLAMVACGLGVTLVPHTSARPNPHLTYHPLRRRVDLVELSLVHRAGPPDHLVDHFVECTTAQ